MLPKNSTVAVIAALFLVPLIGHEALGQSKPELPFEASALELLPAQRPGTSKIVALSELPPPLRRGFSLESSQNASGLAKMATASYFVLPATISDLEMFNRVGSAMIRDNHLLDSVSKGSIRKLDASSDTSDLEQIGFTKEGAPKDGKWNRFARIYRSSKGEMFSLLQWNFVEDGASVLSVRENMNATVNRNPGTLVALVDQAGHTLWKLVWVSGDNHFELYASGLPLSQDSAGRILRIASSVR